MNMFKTGDSESLFLFSGIRIACKLYLLLKVEFERKIMYEKRVYNIIMRSKRYERYVFTRFEYGDFFVKCVVFLSLIFYLD